MNKTFQWIICWEWRNNDSDRVGSNFFPCTCGSLQQDGMSRIGFEAPHQQNSDYFLRVSSLVDPYTLNPCHNIPGVHAIASTNPSKNRLPSLCWNVLGSPKSFAQLDQQVDILPFSYGGRCTPLLQGISLFDNMLIYLWSHKWTLCRFCFMTILIICLVEMPLSTVIFNGDFWRTNKVCECKMDVKPTWIPTWHQMDHVSWSLGPFFKNQLLEVDLTPTGRPWHSECSHLFLYSILSCVKRPTCKFLYWNSMWCRARSHMTSHYTWGSMTTIDAFGGALGQPLDTTFFWLSQFHGHGFQLACEVALIAYTSRRRIVLSKIFIGNWTILAWSSPSAVTILPWSCLSDKPKLHPMVSLPVCAHQTLCLVLAVKLLGIMLRNRCWPTTFLTITTGDANGWYRNLPVWLAPQWPRRFLGITRRYPNVPKSNRLHVHIFRFSFIKLGCIL